MNRPVPLVVRLALAAAVVYVAFGALLGLWSDPTQLKWVTTDSHTFRIYSKWIFGGVRGSWWNPVLLRTYLYPLLLGLMERLAPIAIVVAQFLIWLGTTLLTFAVAHRVTGSTRWATLAFGGFATAISPMVFTFHARSETLATLMPIAAVACLCVGSERWRPSARAVAAVWCLALAVVVKPVFVGAWVLGLAATLALTRRSRASLAAAASLAPIALQLFINYQIVGRPILSIVGYYGTDLWLLPRIEAIVHHDDYRDRMRARRVDHLMHKGGTIDPLEVQAYLDRLSQSSRELILAHPLAFFEAYGASLFENATDGCGRRYMVRTSRAAGILDQISRVENRLFTTLLLAALVAFVGAAARAGSLKAAGGLVRARGLEGAALALAVYVHALHGLTVAESDRYAMLAYPLVAVAAVAAAQRFTRQESGLDG
jgi:hypothetical protein